jgi:hypothetical protein
VVYTCRYPGDQNGNPGLLLDPVSGGSMKPAGRSLAVTPTRLELVRPILMILFALWSFRTAWAQGPIFDLSSSPTFVVSSGGSEVLGTVAFTASASCGGNSDGRCVSSPGTVTIRYLGIPIDNSVATGITVAEIIGGVGTVAPAAGTLITGAVTVENTPSGGQVTFAIKGGADLAAGDWLLVDGVRGRIVSSAASVPGTSVYAQVSVSGTTATFTSTQAVVGQSAAGLEFVAPNPGPGSIGQFTVTYQEGFGGAFVQYVPTATTGLPTNPRPAYGALNNTQLHLIVTGLAGRVEWPRSVPSQLTSGGVVAGGSELQLMSQTFDGSEAIYQFASANQSLSDATVESFAVSPTLCGCGTLSVQAQLIPPLDHGRPAFGDPLIPSPAANPAFGSVLCENTPLVKVSGDNQIGVVGAPLAQPLVVKVQDANGSPVAGVTIRFAASSGGGGVAPASVLTDATGHASTVATLGPLPGTHSFTASVDSLAATFTAKAVPTQVPPFPLTEAIPHIVTGGGFLTRITVVNLSGKANPIQLNFVSQGGELLQTQGETIAPNGRFDVSTDEVDRFADLTVQWVIVGSAWPVGATVFYEVKSRESPVPLTVVSFSAPDPIQTVTVPLAFAPGLAGQPARFTAALALANFSANSNSVDIKLVDADGAVVASDNVALAPFGQTAFVLPERPVLAAALAGREGFFGSIILNASQPLLVMDVGSDFGQYFTVLPFRQRSCFPSPFEPSQTWIAPHLPVGEGWASRVSLTNLCQVQNHVQIEVFNQAGDPVPSYLASTLTLGPLGTAVFPFPEADRFGPLAMRWARITSDAGLGVNVLLDSESSPEATPTSAVGSSGALPLTSFVVPVDFAASSEGSGGAITVGLALANATTSDDDVVLRLLDSQGTTAVEETRITLPAQAQLAFLVSDLPGWRDFFNSQGEFAGSLLVVASQPTAALAVGFDAVRAFALPVFDLSAVATAAQ